MIDGEHLIELGERFETDVVEAGGRVAWLEAEGFDAESLRALVRYNGQQLADVAEDTLHAVASGVLYGFGVGLLAGREQAT